MKHGFMIRNLAHAKLLIYASWRMPGYIYMQPGILYAPRYMIVSACEIYKLYFLFYQEANTNIYFLEMKFIF